MFCPFIFIMPQSASNSSIENGILLLGKNVVVLQAAVYV
jgi:hypothetical protein